MTMPAPVFDLKAPKKAVNLSINADMLRQARAMKINLSKTLEEKLEQLVREERARRGQDAER
jgi:antitoxin CcdA